MRTVRWYNQIAGLALIGVLGAAGWYAYGRLGAFSGEAPPQGTQQQQQRSAAAPPVVETAPAEAGEIARVIEAVGTARSFESMTVTAQAEGTVAAIGFEEGEAVAAGQELVRLDDRELRAELDQIAAQIAQASAQRDEVQQRYDRTALLRKSGAVAIQTLEERELQLRAAENNIKALEARRRIAQAKVDDARVVAPFSGRVGMRMMSIGALVKPGERITSLDDIRKLRIDFSIPEQAIGEAAIGQPVAATSAATGDRRFQGKVTIIDPRVDAATRSARLSAVIENPEEVLHPGMFLHVRLEVSQKVKAVLVPEEALVGDGLRQFVFVVKDNKVDRRVVRIGQRLPGRVEIVEGLAAGETIVVRGVQRVRPGLEVTPKPAAPTS